MQVYFALSGAGLDVNAYRFTEIWNGELPRLLTGEEGLGFLVRSGEGESFSAENISVVLGQLQDARAALEINLAEVASREANLLEQVPEEITEPMAPPGP